jgi:WD40 repeat protein
MITMRRYVLLFVLFLAVSAIPAHAQDDIPNTDGIPANCESSSPYADPNLFPRYANGQLALIDWSSGEVVRVLATDSAAPNFWLLGWSPDCRYLAGGLGDGLRYTTILWDATSGAQVGTVDDGYRRPHFLTWSPRGDALVVETRHGAFLWDLATGTQLQLMFEVRDKGRSFSRIVWNYESGTLDTTTRGGAFAVFDLNTGQPRNITLETEQYIGRYNPYIGEHASVITAPSESSPYGCEHFERRFEGSYEFHTHEPWHLPEELVEIPNVYIRVSENRLMLVREGTLETLQVFAGDFANAVRQGWAYGFLSPQCDMFFTLRFMDRVRYLREGVVLRISDGSILHTIQNMPDEYADRLTFRPGYYWRQQWDATGRYLFAQSYDGAQVWDSATDSTFYVTSADDSWRYGYSVNTVTWDVANGRISVDMLNDDEVRVFDLATGLQVE